MTTETFNRAKGIKEALQILESEKLKVEKLFKKSDLLTKEEVEELCQIAFKNNQYAINILEKEFSEL